MFDSMERRRSELDRHRENSARLALCNGRYETTGQGGFQFEERLDFGVTFIEQPYVSYGSYVNAEDLADLLDLDEDTQPPFPLTAGHVTEWEQDSRDFYTGAWVAVNVYFPPTSVVVVPADALPVVQHHFSFQATAIKDVPVDVRD